MNPNQPNPDKYTWLGVEKPFPWIGILIYSIPLWIIAFALIVGTYWW